MALASGLSALGLSGWSWRLSWPDTPGEVLRLLVWFTWPTLPLAVLTIWHWRRQVTHRHIAVPLLTALVGLLASLSMGANERALLTALPSLAVLAAFALPILQRSLGSAIDWFSVFFFTVCGILIWLGYVALHTGAPARTAERITKLVPGTEAQFSWLALIVALIGTVLWLGLVRWRTARVSHALWKSLVLPAGGVALCWLLFMTLWLPILDQARSYRALVERVWRQIAKERNHIRDLEGKVRGYLEANDRETAGRFALELRKAQEELAENEEQVQLHEAAYENNLAKIKQAGTKLTQVREQIAKYDAELKMTRAEAEVAKLMSSFNIDITTDFGQIEQVVHDKISLNKAKVRVAGDLSGDGVDDLQRQRAMERAMADQALREFEAGTITVTPQPALPAQSQKQLAPPATGTANE